MKMVPVLIGFLACLACTPQRGSGKPTPAHSTQPIASLTPTPYEVLQNLDQRRPVPLLPPMAQHQKENMREHLEAVQAVVSAAALNDFDQVAASAKRMGFSETMGRMCEHMGAAAPGFTEQALAFHHSADEIVSAAARQDGPAVLAALSRTLSACTNCHATFKQQPVSALP
ncbi:MAG TPA: hypothetical protein VHB79_22200 [Polyangiaceae bacterium]|nr:hypothetical protein [Polyangiaceae bacterium]